MNEWKRLSTKKLYSHPRIELWEDTVQLLSGKKIEYLHFGQSADAALIIAIDLKGRILVQKEFSYPPHEWLYQFPGGGLESGESIEVAAKRELAEEANLQGEVTKIGWFYSDNRRKSSKLHVFIARNVSAMHAEKDPEEAFETYWKTEEEVDELIKNGAVVNYSMLAAWALYKNTTVTLKASQ